MFRLTTIRAATAALVLIALAAWSVHGDYLAREITAEIAILAILVLALDLVAGFGGMVSLAHGAIMGVGAYGYALANLAGLPPWPAALVGIVASTATGGVIGAISARLTGVFFLMVTLAFGQMIWALTFRADALGGDNGLGGIARPALPFVDSNDPLVFALYALLMLLACLLLCVAVLRSPFGHRFQAVHDNPARAAALGFAPERIRAQGFAISSMLAGVAGVLAAQHMQFVSPELMVWTASGEVLVVLILGGIGSVTGAMVGAAGYLLLKHWAAGWTDHWHLAVGLLLIAVVLAGGRGLSGLLERRRDA
ncbi:branched-chain amino acid ABC transporter permease [Paracoccus xiamenensis]|uniref:branched-chain amino acid ABC transporter permease n=1 Tax=Paracoccus xiamenensis TaxID=2714901 RepID=UPI00140748F0|nr:branched-chain amino acid ABC transporter permease [Paracoccus xiamenensis]NHF73510.1 branched-chain amino acid ABC transporter permease [Paracoccus xiamenensis]